MLTEIKIKNLKPRERPYSESDSHGLYLEVFPNGSKLWRIRYVTDGKETRRSLGPWPLVSLKEARERNDRRRYEKAIGKEPEKPEKPRMTVSEVCSKWRDKFMPAMDENTRSGLATKLDKHILPSIGTLDVGSLTAEIVMRDLLSAR